MSNLAHIRRVKSLYKKALRSLGDHYDYRPRWRLECVLMRDRFDKNAKLTDFRQIEDALEAGEKELFETAHPQPTKFAESPGGVAYERVVTPPDWILDYWHPLEKAMYPKYFALREQRKKEYLAKWDLEHGKGTGSDHH